MDTNNNALANVTTVVTAADPSGSISRVLRHGVTIGALVETFTPGEGTSYHTRASGRCLGYSQDRNEALLMLIAHEDMPWTPTK